MNTLKPILDFYNTHGGASAWHQGSTRVDADGVYPFLSRRPAVRWCPYGAACHILYHGPLVDSTHMLAELNARVQSLHGGRFVTIGRWNDQPDRTWAEVEEMLSMEDMRHE